MPAKGREVSALKATFTNTVGFGLALAVAAGTTGPAVAACSSEEFRQATYSICEFDTARDRFELFLDDADGTRLESFERLSNLLQSRGQSLRFAMNAGMYHEDRSPVGLHVESGRTMKRASTSDGPGNFHLKPNGIFYVAAGTAHVAETGAFLARAPLAQYATQSGPMLVIGGAVHPKFRADSTSRYRRNGVGVAGSRVVFALAETPVTLLDFALFFRDRAQTPDALYLDGSVSRLYAPELKRNDGGTAMGPIIAVTTASSREKP